MSEYAASASNVANTSCWNVGLIPLHEVAVIGRQVEDECHKDDDLHILTTVSYTCLVEKKKQPVAYFFTRKQLTTAISTRSTRTRVFIPLHRMITLKTREAD